MNNYGDVALDLPADWSRSRMVGDPSFVLTTVGHEGGRGDVYKEDRPDQRHQFRWCAPNDLTAISTLRTRHYDWVLKSGGWKKNDNLWEWDGEGFLIHNGQKLMARDAVYYIEERAEAEHRDSEAKRRRAGGGAEREVDEALRTIEQRGATIEDEQGRQLRPMQTQEKSETKRR